MDQRAHFLDRGRGGGLKLLERPVSSFCSHWLVQVSSQQPLVKTEVETRKEEEFYVCEAWGRESALNGSLVLIHWPVVHSHAVVAFVYNPSEGSLWSRGMDWERERVPFFFLHLDFMIDVVFPPRQARYYATFSALFSSPPPLLCLALSRLGAAS